VHALLEHLEQQLLLVVIIGFRCHEEAVLANLSFSRNDCRDSFGRHLESCGLGFDLQSSLAMSLDHLGFDVVVFSDFDAGHDPLALKSEFYGIAPHRLHLFGYGYLNSHAALGPPITDNLPWLPSNLLPIPTQDRAVMRILDSASGIGPPGVCFC